MYLRGRSLYQLLADQISQSKISIAMFPFKILPPEIRLIIYNLDGVLQYSIDGKRPALLRALQPDQTLYQEARDDFHRINVIFEVSRTGVRHLKSLDDVEYRHVRHVLVNAKEWPTSSSWFAKVFSRIEERVLQYSQLQSLTIGDAPPNTWEESLRRNRFLWTHLPPILELSGVMFNLRKLVIQVRGLRSHDYTEPTLYSIAGVRNFQKCWRLVDKLSICFRVLAKLDRVSPTNQIEDWFWEADDGKYLQFDRLTTEGRKRLRQELGWSWPST